MNKFTLGVLIPTWKRPAKLCICLEHIANQIQKPEQVIVVVRKEDNEGIEVANSFLNKINNLEIVYAHKPGVVFAENTGLEKVNTDLVSFIDDDGYAPDDWLVKIHKFFNENPDAFALGGSDIIKSEPWSYHDFEVSTVGKITYYGKVVGNHHRKALGGCREVDVLKGVNMTFKTRGLPRLDMKLAGVDGNHGNGSQWELDLCLSIKKMGGLLYFDPNLIVVHDSDHSSHVKDIVAFNNTHNMTYVMMKHLNPIRKISFLIFALVVGNEQLPGMLKLLFQMVKDRKFDVFKIYLFKLKGFVAGLKTYIKS